MDTKPDSENLQEIINTWYRPMPKVKKYIDDQRAKPKRGEPCVTALGRKRHFVINDENMYHIQNEYLNTPIQSTASDMTMFSALAIHDYIKENNIPAKIIASVHDSIILEVKDDPQLVDSLAEVCVGLMAEVPKQYLPNITVPFKADAEVGYTYGGLEEWTPSK